MSTFMRAQGQAAAQHDGGNGHHRGDWVAQGEDDGVHVSVSSAGREVAFSAGYRGEAGSEWVDGQGVGTVRSWAGWPSAR